MNGEYLLSLDPYNFDSEEEFVRFYHPELLEEIRSYYDDENTIEENFYKG